MERTEYVYESEEGLPLFKVTRHDGGSEGKRFAQSRHDGTKWVSGTGCMQGVVRVPYRLPNWVNRKAVLLVEGEKCVEVAELLGVPATTTPGGSSAWKQEYAAHFAGKTVILLPDNDEAGRRYMDEAGRDLLPVAARVILLELPGISEGEDIAEWVANGGTRSALGDLIRAAPPFQAAVEMPAEGSERPFLPSEASGSHEAVDLSSAPVGPEEQAIRSIDEQLHSRAPLLDQIRRIRQISGDALTAAGPDAALDLIRWPVVQERVCLEETAYIRRGFPTGMDPLDAITCGLRSGWWVIRGESGMGKTTLVNSWVHASAKEGMPWLIVALEDPWMAWRTMMLGRLSNVDGLLIATGNYLTPGSREAVEAHAEAVAEIEAGIYLPKSEAFPMTVRKFISISEAWCQAIVKKPGGDGGIVLDPPQVLVKAGGEEGLFDRMTELTAHLLSLVDRWRIPVLTTTHLNRQGQELGGTMFEFSAHVRVQVAIGEKAKELNDELPQDEGRFEPYVDVNVTKNKGMPTGRILTRYRKRYARWDVMSAADEEEPVKALPEPQEGPAPEEEEGPPERQFGLYEHHDD